MITWWTYLLAQHAQFKDNDDLFLSLFGLRENRFPSEKDHEVIECQTQVSLKVILIENSVVVIWYSWSLKTNGHKDTVFTVHYDTFSLYKRYDVYYFSFAK